MWSTARASRRRCRWSNGSMPSWASMLRVRPIWITDQAAAERARFPGSPTVRVAGRDVEPGAELSDEYTLECRLYRHEFRLVGYPQVRWVREALVAAVGQT